MHFYMAWRKTGFLRENRKVKMISPEIKKMHSRHSLKGNLLNEYEQISSLNYIIYS